MVKNVMGGNKTKKQKRYRNRDNPIDNLMDNQMFGVICENMGAHMFVLCSDGIKRKGDLSGKARKGPRLNVGSYVAVSLREFEIEKKNCDILGIATPSAEIISLFKKNDKKDNLGIPFVEETTNKYSELDNQQSVIVDVSDKESESESESESEREKDGTADKKDYYGRSMNSIQDEESVWKTKEEEFEELNRLKLREDEQEEDDDWLNSI